METKDLSVASGFQCTHNPCCEGMLSLPERCWLGVLQCTLHSLQQVQGFCDAPVCLAANLVAWPGKSPHLHTGLPMFVPPADTDGPLPGMPCGGKPLGGPPITPCTRWEASLKTCARRPHAAQGWL